MSATKKHRISLPKRIIFMMIIMGLCFGGFEILLRVTGFTFATGTYELTEGEVIEYHWSKRGLVRDPLLPWSWIPAPGADATQPARNDFRYNAFGFRGPEYSKKKDKGATRIICMGDSCTLGWDSPDGETYPDYLRDALNHLRSGNFEVINAGVSGFSSFQGIHDFHTRIKQWQPDIIIVSYNWNDHGDAPDRIYGPAVYKPNERKQFPDNKMPSSRVSYGFIHELQKVRLVQALTKCIWSIQGRSQEATSLKTAENGDIAAVQSAFPAGTGLRRVSPDDFRLNFWEFRRIANQHGIELIFMTQPANPVQHRDIEPWATYYSFQDQYNELIRRVAANSKTPLVDPLKDQWLSEAHFYDHVHTRPTANKVIAEMVLQEVILATGRLN